MKFSLILVVLLSLFFGSVQGQSYQDPPTNNFGTSYSYCEALNSSSTTTATYYGFYYDKWLLTSDCVDGWSMIFGNTITIKQWGAPLKTFWVNWNEVENPTARLATWRSNPWAEPLTIIYEPQTMMIKSITSPSFPTWE